jgi:hypothetical protein
MYCLEQETCNYACTRGNQVDNSAETHQNRIIFWLIPNYVRFPGRRKKECQPKKERKEKYHSMLNG